MKKAIPRSSTSTFLVHDERLAPRPRERSEIVESSALIDSGLREAVHGHDLHGTPCPHASSWAMNFQLPKEVLVVEDEPFVRMVAADALTERGIMAWEAGDAGEALHVLEEHPNIGLVFTDVNMPGDMDGLGLAQEVYRRRPDVTLIVTSGAVTVRDDELPDHGTFLAKPYPPGRLVQIVQEKLDGPTP